MTDGGDVSLERVIATALEVVESRGIAAVSCATVAERLGLQREDLPESVTEDHLLLREMMVAALAGPTAAIEQAVAEAPTGEAALEGFLRATLEHYYEHDAHARFLLALIDHTGARRTRIDDDFIDDRLGPVNDGLSHLRGRTTQKREPSPG